MKEGQEQFLIWDFSCYLYVCGGWGVGGVYFGSLLKVWMKVCVLNAHLRMIIKFKKRSRKEIKQISLAGSDFVPRTSNYIL